MKTITTLPSPAVGSLSVYLFFSSMESRKAPSLPLATSIQLCATVTHSNFIYLLTLSYQTTLKHYITGVNQLSTVGRYAPHPFSLS